MTDEPAPVQRLLIRTTDGAFVGCPRQNENVDVSRCQSCGQCIGFSVRDSFLVCGWRSPDVRTLKGDPMTRADSAHATHGSTPGTGRGGSVCAPSLGRFERPVVTANLDDSVYQVACRMRDEHVGCVVVIRDGRPVGMLTDRDLALRVVAEGLDPRSVLVSSIVTYDAATILRSDGIETAVRTMREHCVRRVPIVDEDGRVTGIVTADDLVALFSSELSALGEAITSNVDGSESR